jgi:hypothetical protein
MNPIQLLNALSNVDSVEFFREWKKEFCVQLRGTHLENLYDPRCDTLSVDTDKFYYVAFIIGTEFIPKAAHFMENLFYKLKIRITKVVDQFVFPHLTNLIQKDETLRLKIFGHATSTPLDEESWVSHCLSWSLNTEEEVLSEFMEIRKHLLTAAFNFLSVQTRVDDPKYKKFICLSDPFKIFEMMIHGPFYETSEEAQQEASNYYPPIRCIGQLGVDFILSHSRS